MKYRKEVDRVYKTSEEDIIKEMLPTVKRIASDLIHNLPKERGT